MKAVLDREAAELDPFELVELADLAAAPSARRATEQGLGEPDVDLGDQDWLDATPVVLGPARAVVDFAAALATGLGPRPVRSPR